MTEKRKPATAAKQKYNEKAYDRLYPYVKKGKKEIYLRAAEAEGKSLNEFIETAADERARKIIGE